MGQPEPFHKPAYDRDDLLAAGQGNPFGPNTAKLPLPNMLMLDRITAISGKGGRYNQGELIAELDITPDLWFFACHFVDDPVMPGCLGLDALWQLMGFFMTWSGHRGKGRALGVGEVKFKGQVLPTNKLVTYHIHIKRIFPRRLILGIGDGTVAVDGKEIYTVNGLRVGLFQSLDGFSPESEA